jgi:phosphorylase kinase gamma subunit
MFTLLVGCPPFWHRKQMIMLRNIMEGKYSFTSPEWADISGNLSRNFDRFASVLSSFKFRFSFPEDPKDLIRKCLVVDPNNRITVKEALAHSFFATVVSWLSYPPQPRQSLQITIVATNPKIRRYKIYSWLI